MYNIIFIAPPAAGKGTVSDFLVKTCDYIHISTGDILREEIKSGSEFGKYIDSLISKGNLVPDEDMIKLIGQLDNFDNEHKIILDGFPRTLNQAQVLDDLFIRKNINQYIAIYLDVDIDLAMRRALGRVNCPKCGRTYNIYSDDLKPLNDNLCDDCAVSLVSRSDDNEETFKKRFLTYLEVTAPVIDYYEKKGILVRVDATQKLDDIQTQVLEAVTYNSSRILKEANND